MLHAFRAVSICIDEADKAAVVGSDAAGCAYARGPLVKIKPCSSLMPACLPPFCMPDKYQRRRSPAQLTSDGAYKAEKVAQDVFVKHGTLQQGL